MPGDDLLIGNDGDYIDDGAGAFTLTETVASTVRHALLDIFGEWVGDPDAGREILGIEGRNSTAAEAELEAESYRVALEPLEEDGLIDDIDIEVVRVLPTRFQVNVRMRDTQSGGTIEFANLNEFGV